MKTFAYNTLHQLTGTTVSLPQTSLLGELSDEDYSTTVSYDGTGAATTLTHDAIGGLPVQTVTTALDKLGRGRTLTVADAADTRTLVTGTSFDTLGRLTGRDYGNGVERSFQHDPLWNSVSTAGLLYWTDEVLATYAVPHAITYERDNAGRVTSVLEGYDLTVGNNITVQCYTYDGHNRLETAWLDADYEAPCATEPELATQPTGDDAALAFAVGYEYLPTGQVDTITNLLTEVVSEFDYTDTSSPNAVTSVTDGTVTDSFTYDSAGRMVTRTVNSVSTDLVWDASSNLVATSGQGGDIVYLYDAGGQRVAQISVGDVGVPTPVSATAYFGATQVTDPDTASSTGGVDATRYFTFGGSTVATATSTGGGAPSWALLFGDIQGSAQVMMELVVDTGQATGFATATSAHTVTRDAYMPYGAERGSGDLPIDRGWLGQVEDTGTGLTYLNARYYDPAIGRFLSPDPLMDPGDPRTLDPYRYADNNPVVYMDPSGLAPSCSGLSGDAYKMCNDYSKNTYNYTTGKTVVQNNIDKAKAGPTSGGKKSGGSGVVSEPVVCGAPPLLFGGGSNDSPWWVGAGTATGQGFLGLAGDGPLMGPAPTSAGILNPAQGPSPGFRRIRPAPEWNAPVLGNKWLMGGVKAAPYLDVVAAGLVANENYYERYGDLQDQEVRAQMTVERTAVTTTTGIVTALVVTGAVLSFVSCPLTAGAGCAVGVAVLAAGAGGFAAYGAEELAGSAYDSANQDRYERALMPGSGGW